MNTAERPLWERQNLCSKFMAVQKASTVKKCAAADQRLRTVRHYRRDCQGSGQKKGRNIMRPLEEYEKLIGYRFRTENF